MEEIQINYGNVENPSPKEVTEVIQQLKNHIAPGIDSIPNELIKYAGIEREIYKLIQQI